MGDSVEPSVSWSNLWRVINAMKETWKRETDRLQVQNFLGFRISQIYFDGVCLYIYYGIGHVGNRNQFEIFDGLYLKMRDAMLSCGASLSHHHGIGKKGSKLYPKAISQVGVETYKSIKARLDPNNVFDAGNLVKIETKPKL
jgi:alkyldihydroxyacetonephosphate synthase